MPTAHGLITTPRDIHAPFQWTRETDPTADTPNIVEPGDFWLQVSTATLKRRKDDDSGWDTLIPSPAAPHTHVVADITDFAEGVDDRVAALVVAGTGISATYDDAAGSLTIANTATLDAEGVRDTMAAALVAGANVTITVDDPGDTITIAATSGGGLSDPTTTKGDLLANDGTALDRLGVGADGDVLTADSAAALGVAWAANPAGFSDPLTTKGDLIVRAASTTRLGVGTDGQVLTADASAAEGVAWADAAGGGSTTPFIRDNFVGMVQKPPGNSTTLQTTGVVGASVSTGSSAAADDADGPWNNYTSSATNNAEAKIRQSNLQYDTCRRAWKPSALFRIKTPSSLANLRTWVGLFSATPGASADPAIHGAGFRYDTVADGTAFWRCWTNDGTSGGTVTTTSIAVTTDTAHNFRLELDASEVRFYIDGMLVATHTTDLPDAAQSLGFEINQHTLEAVAKSILFGRLAIWFAAGA